MREPVFSGLDAVIPNCCLSVNIVCCYWWLFFRGPASNFFTCDVFIFFGFYWTIWFLQPFWISYKVSRKGPPTAYTWLVLSIVWINFLRKRNENSFQPNTSKTLPLITFNTQLLGNFSYRVNLWGSKMLWTMVVIKNRMSGH